MTGKELFDQYYNNPGEVNSEAWNYRQLLMTIWSNIFDEIYPLLLEAEKQGKKLDLKPWTEDPDILWDELTVVDIILV